MYYIEIPSGINNIFFLFYRVGIWHRGNGIIETGIKLFYSIYHLFFSISLMAGAITSNHKNEKIFSAEAAISITLLTMKIFYLIWRKKDILEILTRIGVYSFEDYEEFTLATNKLKKFMKFVVVLVITVVAGGYIAVFLPIFRTERKMFLKIAFPLDWKNDDVAFWIAIAFLFGGNTLSLIASFFSVIIWYVMLNCALRYEILGGQMRNMGVIKTSHATANTNKISDLEKQEKFRRDLIATIVAHQHIKKYS